MKHYLLIASLSLASSCLTPTPPEEGILCNDDVDNDEDGAIDCEDTSCQAESLCQPTCGDGVVNQPSEQCDGSDLAGNSCTSLGFPDGTLACDLGTCTIDTNGCQVACTDNDQDGFASVLCGGDDCDDAVFEVHPGAIEICDGVDSNCDEVIEVCSDGNDTNGDGCSATCVSETCGNGVINQFEQCDEGANNSDTGLSTCHNDCRLSSCGDGIVTAGEVCFAPSVTLQMPGRADSLVVSDLDGANGPDIASTHIDTNEVIVLFNDGVGGFPLSADIQVLGGPFSIAAADFDGVNGNDLVIGTQFAQSAKVSLNQGNHNFASTFDILNPFGGISVITAADVDSLAGNGVDILLGSSGVTFARNTNNSATFTNLGSTDGPNIPVGITTGDFDGDGDLDYATNTTTVFVNTDGLGAMSTSHLNSGDDPLAITNGDFDNDGDLDLAVTNRPTKQVRIFANNGSAVFTETEVLPTGIDGAAIVTGDLDQDGHLDLIVGALGESSVSILLGTNNGFASHVQLGGFGGSRSIGAEDINGDSVIDLVVANHLSTTISLFFANP